MKKQYDIIGNRKKFFLFSTVLIVFILLFSLVFGVEMDIQFKGGAMLTYGYEGEASLSAVQRDIESVLGSNVTLQTGSSIATGAQTLTISMPGTQTVETETVEQLSAALTGAYPELNFRQLSMNNVDPTIGGEFFAKSIVAVVAASVLILVYIAIRFKNIGGWPAGCMAIVALIHDLIVVYGVFVLMRVPLNGNFIAALLTILGYSINDTVVIYDRVRENRQLHGNTMDFATLVNTSINQSLARSIKTTVTTLLALGTVCVVSMIYGLDSIFTFAFPLIIGMISGVYSTVCIAGPLWVEWELRKKKK
ncbi:MAG: protein translocase subunit SecF [Subdoligranulum sp.]|nr:protein translocase subunit SecF [Subdoligranulum sp.]